MPWSTLLSAISTVSVLAVLLSCAPKRTVEIPVCQDYWTIAPANLIVELAAQNEVWLNPAYADFPLFCTAYAAQKSLRERQGGWAVFRLAANSDCAELREKEIYLARPAQVTDWESLDHTAHPKATLNTADKNRGHSFSNAP
ncbi:MAG: hypothetical protein IJU76_09325 [Desulfovibrionaceae bacterium]|nr:hypothetical protein [Desulfovibrionaceae bacterium]